MKRLIKKANNIILYHGTNFQNFEKIMNDKFIIPQGGGGAGIDSTTNKKDIPTVFDGFIFFTDNFDLAADYCSWSSGGLKPHVVLEVQLPTNILLPDDNDAPDAVDWEESIDECGQVKVNDKISISQITNIIFFGPDLRINCNVNNWKEQYEANKDIFFKSMN